MFAATLHAFPPTAPVAELLAEAGGAAAAMDQAAAGREASLTQLLAAVASVEEALAAAGPAGLEEPAP